MKIFNMRAARTLALTMIAGSAALAAPAFADTEMKGYPSHWRLQDYEDCNITLWYTGSACTNGNLVMPSSTSVESRERLWSLLLTAVAMNRQVGIFYNAGCQITDFYSDGD